MENNQREITHKILKPELWFLCMTHRLIMLNKCTKFYSGAAKLENTSVDDTSMKFSPYVLYMTHIKK